MSRKINELLAIQGDKVPVQDIHDGLQKLIFPMILTFSFRDSMQLFEKPKI